MNPSSKGWLNEYYVHFRSEQTEIPLVEDYDKFVYDVLSKSSIIFSIPLESVSDLHPNLENWNFKEKIKIVFSNLLFIVSQTYIRKNNFVVNIDEIYARFSKSQGSDLDTEQYIDKLIEGKKNSLFLNTYNTNPWLFFSLIEFYLFLEKQTIENPGKVRLEIVKGMILAAKSNQSLSKKEDRLLKRYIENGGFSVNEKLKLYEFIKKNTSFISPDFTNYNQIIKQSAYDLALLTLMTDSKIDSDELGFINDYEKKLGISTKEQHLSFSLIQEIHLNHYKFLPYENKLYSFTSVKDIVSHNFKFVLKKNLSMIVNEIRESKELLGLLRKSANEKLSKEEKEKVKEQIFDILKTIPSLSIFLIPGGSLILPILMKILPQDLLTPSSFVNKVK